MRIAEVIEKIAACHPPQSLFTCDTVKCGNPNQRCTGIAVTCYPSPNVIRRAAEEGLNLIVCHEAAFYNHEDETAWLAEDPVYRAKRALLQQTGVVGGIMTASTATLRACRRASWGL